MPRIWSLSFAVAILLAVTDYDLAHAAPVSPGLLSADAPTSNVQLARYRGGGGGYRGGGYRGGAYRGGGYRGGAYRGGVYRGGAYRGGVYRGGVYRGGVYRGGVYGWRLSGWRLSGRSVSRRRPLLRRGLVRNGAAILARSMVALRRWFLLASIAYRLRLDLWVTADDALGERQTSAPQQLRGPNDRAPTLTEHCADYSYAISHHP